MKILRFEVHGLLGSEKIIRGAFNGDLAIVTGRNGSGKTSLLKLIWYVIGGNILQALREVEFRRFILETSEYTCAITKISRVTCKIDLTVDGETTTYEDFQDDDTDEYFNAEDMVNPKIRDKGSSVFFPTFRRIEGGFTLENNRSLPPGARARASRSDVEEALVALSRRLTNEPHVFVSAISTVDIVSLLLRQYAELSEVSNSIQQQTSQEIIETIKEFKSDPQDSKHLHAATNVIDSIRSKVESMESNRERIMTPIGEVRQLVERLFVHNGIRIGTRLSFGDAARAVSSDVLSAGEKQMLSFICYNAFYTNSVILIDEPELSLHVDWQRQLFPILMRQQSSNQFIIATHSPFIYSKYPDKEVLLDVDRGDIGSEVGVFG